MDDLFGLNVLPQDGRLRSLDSQSTARTILLVCPTMWDEAELPHIVEAGGYRVLIYGTDVSEHPEDFDAIDFIDRAVEAVAGREIDGVMASDDYPGSIVAAAIACKLHLPGPKPEAVLLCQHKYYSRMAQRKVVPEAVPAFCPLNGSHLLAEEPLRGRQVTVEGCMFRGEGRVIGITDSIMYPGTISFERFEYPSLLSPAVQKRMTAIIL